MATPELSLIIPAMNAAPYLSTLFTSLHKQGDMSNVQIIFIDDGSSDETPLLLDEYGSQFPHFEVVTNETNVGPANGRNQGLDRAQGDYIVFLDGDDWLADNHLPTLLDAAKALDVDFIRCDHTTVTGNKRVLKRAPMALRNRPLNPRYGILPVHDSTMVDYPYPWAGMFHRRLKDSGMLYFPKDFMTAEDREWIWNLHLNADSFATVDAPGVLYRRDVAGSLTQIVDERQLMFADAFEGIFRLVEADRDASLWWHKAVRNWLAIVQVQVERFSLSPQAMKNKLYEKSRAVSALVPKDVLLREFAQSKPNRQRAVLPALGVTKDAFKELIK